MPNAKVYKVTVYESNGAVWHYHSTLARMTVPLQLQDLDLDKLYALPEGSKCRIGDKYMVTREPDGTPITYS